MAAKTGRYKKMEGGRRRNEHHREEGIRICRPSWLHCKGHSGPGYGGPPLLLLSDDTRRRRLWMTHPSFPPKHAFPTRLLARHPACREERCCNRNEAQAASRPEAGTGGAQYRLLCHRCASCSCHFCCGRSGNNHPAAAAAAAAAAAVATSWVLLPGSSLLRVIGKDQKRVLPGRGWRGTISGCHLLFLKTAGTGKVSVRV